MKIELTSLESEPLLYFLTHSGVFIVGLGFVFFLLGLWFGMLTAAGRLKKAKQALRAESDVLRGEIASLRLKPQVSLPLGPVILPKEEVLNQFEEAKEPAEFGWLSAGPEVEEISLIPSLPLVPESLLPNKEQGGLEVKAKPRLRSVTVPQPQRRPVEDILTPFSFLLPENDKNAEQEAEEESAIWKSVSSALSAIIATENAAKVAQGAAPPSMIPEDDDSLGMVFKESPLDVDDLTRIHGITPALQNRLQELGVYRLQQIAQWNQSQVREFSRRLSFTDRIDRERWVEQARRLMVAESI